MYAMSARAGEPGRLHPAVNAEVPVDIERERQPDATVLAHERIESGGLSDDPTESGAPVVDTHPCANLTGGR
jgi:hypothetical protein